MAGIIPIPNTRVSGLLLRQRLTQQFQSDQLELFRLQEQVSTGQRIVLPSDDGPAALRAIALQRLIERKDQLSTNVRIGQQFLAATDTALQDVATNLANIKGSTLGVAGTLTSDTERNAAIAEINTYLESLVKLANRQFQGRYLFSGAKTTKEPYSFVDGYVVYHGDAADVRSYSDFGVLFASNASGQEVFGGITAQVESSVDLNPQLNTSTSLSSLRQGRGITPGGAITISDGTHASTIDLSSARTIGDVVRLIQENPPAGREIQVKVTGTGLNLRLLDPDSIGGNLTVTDVANGDTARELGILETGGVGTSELVGEDLNPIIRKTTKLIDLLGAKARTLIRSGSSSDNNDILLEAAVNGTAYNGVAVQFVDDDLLEAAPGVSAGNEFVEYDPNARAASAALKFTGAGNDIILTAAAQGTAFNDVVVNVVDGGAIGDAAVVNYDSITKTLTVGVDSSGATTIQTVIDEIANEGTFTAAYDPSVDGAGNYNPAATISAGDVGIVHGNTGNSGGAAKTLYVHIKPGSSNAEQVVDAINAEGTFTASLDPNDATSAVESGTGVVSLAASADLTSGGSGETLDLASGLRVVNGGQVHEITFENADTVEDLLNVLNSSDAQLRAEINADGTGINIRSLLSGSDFQIGENGGTTAAQLGVRTFDQTTKLSGFNYGVGVPTQEGFNLPTVNGTDFAITTRDGQTFNVDLTGVETLADVVSTINSVTGANVTAQLAAPGNILELVDNTIPTVPGTSEFSIERGTGSLAAQYLGLVPNGETTVATTANTLTGDDYRYVDFTITTADGSTFGVDLSNTVTVGDVINAINAIAGGAVTAQLAAVGNGVQLVDNTAGAGSLTVTQVEGSQAAELFGFVPKGESLQSSSTGTLTSADRNFLENESVFNTLIRLRDALTNSDLNGIERALAVMNDDIDRVTFARADIGSTLQGLELSERTLQDEDIQLHSALSDEIDVDLVEAISELTARQIAVQASLQVTGNILQLTLLDFI